MSDQPAPPPYQYKMVNGALVALTAEEIAELERRDVSIETPMVDAPLQPEPKSEPHAHSRIKRR